MTEPDPPADDAPEAEDDPAVTEGDVVDAYEDHLDELLAEGLEPSPRRRLRWKGMRRRP